MNKKSETVLIAVILLSVILWAVVSGIRIYEKLIEGLCI